MFCDLEGKEAGMTKLEMWIEGESMAKSMTIFMLAIYFKVWQFRLPYTF